MDKSFLAFRLWNNSLQLLAVNTVLLGFQFYYKNNPSNKLKSKILTPETNWKPLDGNHEDTSPIYH